LGTVPADFSDEIVDVHGRPRPAFRIIEIKQEGNDAGIGKISVEFFFLGR
jgi:hypothetical protein